jgi:hypothetical protein
MTRFWRNGFFRWSAQGTEHWVEGHWVERDAWDRSDGTFYCRVLAAYRADERATARYVDPNATCPVCGASVFFYQNEFGSRVFFDELGPPWPKHPCTDNSGVSRPISKGKTRTEPELRLRSEANTISDYLKEAGVDLVARFKRGYGHAPWNLYRVAGRFRAPGATLLVLTEPFGAGDAQLKYVSAQKIPAVVQTGTSVYLKRGRLSYFDVRVMEPREMQVAPLRAAADFARSLIGSDEHNSAL